MKLRAIHLGNVSGAQLTAAFDVPAFTADDDLTIIFGTVRDEHLWIGSHLRWEDRLATRDERFTYSRCSTRAGMMYYRDVGLFRAWVDQEMLSPLELQLALQKAAAAMVHAHVPNHGKMHIEGHYVYLEDKKFAGISANLINEKSNCILCINKDPVDFDSLREVFFTKTFDSVRDLSAFKIPDSAYLDLVSWLGKGFSLPVEWSSFTPRELEILRELEKVHASEAWLERSVREDLDCFAFYERGQLKATG
jgi:hypothetical protein